MPVMIQIRNVPEPIHAEFRQRARRAGQSLSDYLLSMLEREAARMSPEQATALIEAQPPALLDISAAELLREARIEEGWE